MAVRLRTPDISAPPVATSDTATTDFDSTVSIPVLDNDSGSSIRIQSIDTTSTQGTASISGSNIVYDPNGAFDSIPFNTTDTDSFSYTVTDPFVQISTATVTVTVDRGLPAPPVANNKSAIVEFDETTTVPVLSNDTGMSISIQSIDTSSTQGTATQLGSTIVYDPNGQFDGSPFGVTDTDQFNYTIVDSFGQTDTATVDVTVNRQPAASPVATNDTITTDFDTAVTIPVLSNDTGTSISIASIDDTGTGGTVTMSGSDILYDPNGAFDNIPFESNIIDSFTYTIEDPFGQTDSATVDVTVQKAAAVIFNNSFDVSSEDNGPRGVAFDAAGTRMFMVGTASDSVHTYDLSTAFDVTTASFATSFDVSSQDDSPRGVTFAPNGSRMFVSGSSTDKVYQYNLGTDFDTTTASFSGNALDTSSEDGVPQGVAFNTNGTRMFVPGFNTSTLYQYNLSTAFDVSSALFQKSFSVGGQDSQPTGVTFNGDGTRMFVAGNQTSKVYQYDLGTAFDLSTASFASSSFDVSSEASSLQGVEFSGDGSRMFVVGDSTDRVYQYDITVPFELG